LRVNPQLAASHFNLGKIFQDADRFDEALGEYRSAIGFSRICSKRMAISETF